MEDSGHLSDEELVLTADAELAAGRIIAIERHLSACWQCRTRRQELEGAVMAFVRCQQEIPLPASDTSRAALIARIRTLPQSEPERPPRWMPPTPVWRVAAGACALTFVLLGVAWLQVRHSGANRAVFQPSPQLTPGAALVMDRDQLCHSTLPKNKGVSADLRRKVFQVYGIAQADPKLYEVDYLITPALGGAEDVRNLWPQSYMSTVWNARVKDELEDRLHELVCHGDLELSQAQHDIATNWIDAYKKYVGAQGPTTGQ